MGSDVVAAILRRVRQTVVRSNLIVEHSYKVAAEARDLARSSSLIWRHGEDVKPERSA